MVVKAQGALTCQSSTIAIWADSGPFLVLLLSFGGPGVLADSGPFVDYYSLFWRLEEISAINEPRGAFTCQSSTLTVLVDSFLFHGLLLTVLGRRSDFHD